MMKQSNKSYQRLDKSKGSDDSDNESIEFSVKTSKSPKKEIVTVEKDVEEGDTLQSLAIRYRCTIEELKRLNQIHKDNEIYARRTIKVPYRPFSEALTDGHENELDTTAKLVDVDAVKPKIETELTVTSDNVNEIIFNSNLVQKVEELDLSETESDNLLIQEDRATTIVSRLSCNGSDADISFQALIICIFVMIFALPLIYVFYVAEYLKTNPNQTDLAG